MISNNNHHFKIKGKSIKTKYGTVRPILVDEYEKFIPYISFLKKYPRTIKSILFNMKVNETDDYEKRGSYKNDLDNNDLVYFIIKNDYGLKDSLNDMLNFIMDDYDSSIYTTILESDDSWDEFRKFILSFNGIIVEDESDDPEIRKFDEYSRALKEAKGQTVDFESIYTSILVRTGMDTNQINNLTIYQFYSIFKRIGAFFNYETSTLYKTVDSKGTINVIPWSTVIEKNNKESIKLSDFGKKFGKDFN